MQKVIGVRLGGLAKVYFFLPNGQRVQAGDKVVVSTALGISIGDVVFAEREIDESKLDGEIKEIVRKATAKDIEQDRQNQEKAHKCLKTVRAEAKKLGLEMKIVSATYTFDGSKVLIDFTAEDRVDFRELLKILATELKTRIELRQIGQRDEVKIKGGIGPCGEICCCTRFLKEFEHVTVKMAKNQGLSLSPTKISGLCGRLMCCLSYENSVYEDVLSRMPKVNSSIDTPSGKGSVVYNDLLKERVTVKIPQGEDSFNVVEFALSELNFDKAKGQKQDNQSVGHNKAKEQSYPQNTTNESKEEKNVTENTGVNADNKQKKNKHFHSSKNKKQTGNNKK